MNPYPFVINFVDDFWYGLQKYREALPFIRQHRLWEGILQISWLSNLLLLVIIVLSLEFTVQLFDFLSQFSWNNPLVMGNDVHQIASSLWKKTQDLLFNGGFKYIVIITMQVFIAHLSAKTRSILSNSDYQNSTLKAYLSGKWRSFLVVIRNFFYEIWFTIIMSLIISTLSVEFLEPLLAFLIQCYFLGFVIMDGFYSNTLTIKESAAQIREYVGLALALGIIFYLLLLIPLVGVILAPCTVGVAATLALYTLTQESEPEAISI